MLNHNLLVELNSRKFYYGAHLTGAMEHLPLTESCVNQRRKRPCSSHHNWCVASINIIVIIEKRKQTVRVRYRLQLALTANQIPFCCLI